jgi:predicted acylesterase/phospholipase RssA
VPEAGGTRIGGIPSLPPGMKVLSIDGGGIRGLIPALVLAEVERRTGRRTAELFDLIAGTSTGGIIACALSRRGEDGRPAQTAEEVADLYLSEGPKIFDRSLVQQVTSLGGLVEERYDDAGLNAALETYLGATRLKEVLCDVFLTAYDIQGRFAFFFRSSRARTDDAYDFSLVEATRATCAAPTYFEPVEVTDAAGARTYPLIDGGIYAVNPAMCAYAEARRHQPERSVLLVSLGTGELTRSLPYDAVRGWGLREWIWPHTPILSVMFDGMSDTVDYQLTQVLEDGLYFRFQPKLDLAKDEMDDAGPENLRALKLQAVRLLAERDEAARFERVCELLAEPVEPS